jgi:hypothetical protein
MSAFVLDDGVVYHTYSTYARGVDGLWEMYQWLDPGPKGRNETSISWKRHDESEEGHMCPAYIASTAVMVAGGPDPREEFWRCAWQVQKIFQSESSRSASENEGEIRWQQAKRGTRNTGKGISR